MPLYEFHCAVDGMRFERLLPSLPEDERAACPQCGAPSPLVPSVPVMRPDSNWHFGEIVGKQGYIDSSSRIARARKREGLVQLGGRDDWEAMKKTADQAQAEWNEKLAEKTSKHFEKTFAGSGVVDSDGYLTPDATKKISDEPIKSTKDNRIG